MTERMKQQLDFIIEIDKMKSIYRQTMVTDCSRAETDAEHSWHFAMGALLLYEYAAEDGVDLHRVIQMALSHDLVEIYAGDTFAYDTQGYTDKPEREQDAADKLFAILPPDQGAFFRALWEEFERMDTPTARYAAAIDRLMPLISNHVTKGYTWMKHGVTQAQIYKRMRPLESALPELWEYVEQVVREARENQFVR